MREKIEKRRGRGYTESKPRHYIRKDRDNFTKSAEG